MHVIEPAIFGVVQGLAEFLPISSSGHLVLLHSLTHFSVGDDLTFDIALHFGTLLAVVLYFWRDLVRLLVAWVRSFRRWNVGQDADQRLAWILFVATIPGALAGVLLEKTADTTFRSPLLVGIAMIVVGVLLWAVDRSQPQRDTMDRLGWRQSLLIGLGQAVALLPGVSRSGATITMGRWFKLNREAAAKFSFLLSAPILAGAAAVKLLDLRHMTLTAVQRNDFLIGMFVAAIVGYGAIRVLLRYLNHHSYQLFMWYRVTVGSAAIVISLLVR